MSKTKSYTIQVEDQTYRYALVDVEASSAAEAALIARRMAYDGDLKMHYQFQLRDPAIYNVEGVAQLGGLPGTSPNEGCLTDHIETLLKLEGLDPAMEEEFEEYADDRDSNGYMK